MDKKTYSLLESFMLNCMKDTAHDKEHIYRVLGHALEIAKTEMNVNYDILIAACLLHDIGRKEQLENPPIAYPFPRHYLKTIQEAAHVPFPEKTPCTDHFHQPLHPYRISGLPAFCLRRLHPL
ncbi:HD domain-containing protein [bacterium D16-54]|nr:HD domain-containing protein [bacterium D16-54]RKJ17079.1 HD domain-containing protein [bacterium D16-56]